MPNVPVSSDHLKKIQELAQVLRQNLLTSTTSIPDHSPFQSSYFTEFFRDQLTSHHISSSLLSNNDSITEIISSSPEKPFNNKKRQAASSNSQSHLSKKRKTKNLTCLTETETSSSKPHTHLDLQIQSANTTESIDLVDELFPFLNPPLTHELETHLESHSPTVNLSPSSSSSSSSSPVHTPTTSFSAMNIESPSHSNIGAHLFSSSNSSSPIPTSRLKPNTSSFNKNMNSLITDLNLLPNFNLSYFSSSPSPPLITSASSIRIPSSPISTPAPVAHLLPSSPADLQSSPVSKFSSHLPHSRMVLSSPESSSSSPSLSSPSSIPLLTYDSSNAAFNSNEKAAIGNIQAIEKSKEMETESISETQKKRIKEPVLELSIEEDEDQSMHFNELPSTNEPPTKERKTKVLARNKIVGLFNRYGDFVKLKRSERANNESSDSDPDPDFDDLLSQSSTHLNENDIEMEVDKNQGQKSSLFIIPETATISSFSSFPKTQKEDLSLVSLSSSSSSSSSQYLTTSFSSSLPFSKFSNTNAKSTSISKPIRERSEDLFDPMHIQPCSSSPISNSFSLASSSSFILSSFLYPFSKEQKESTNPVQSDPPVFLRLAARNILRNVKKEVSPLKRIEKLYGHPERKRLAFHSSKPLLHALRKEANDAKASAQTSILPLVDEGFRQPRAKFKSKQSRTARTRPSSFTVSKKKKNPPKKKASIVHSAHAFASNSVDVDLDEEEKEAYSRTSSASSNTLVRPEKADAKSVSLDDHDTNMHALLDTSNSTDSIPSSMVSSSTSLFHSHLLKRQPRPDTTPIFSMERDPCHDITLVTLPDSCTFCTLTILSGDTFSLEKSVMVYETEIIPSQIYLLSPHLSHFFSKFFLEASENTISSPFGPVLTLFLDTCFRSSSPEAQLEYRTLIRNYLLKLKNVLNEKTSFPLFQMCAWIALWMQLVNEADPDFQTKVLSQLLKTYSFPFDNTLLKDSFQALILLSIHTVSSPELLSFSTLQPRVELQWFYIFYVQVIVSQLRKPNSKVMCWRTISNLMTKTDTFSLPLALSRVFNLVYVYHWTNFPRDLLVRFKDVYLHSPSTSSDFTSFLPPVKTALTLAEKFLYLFDSIFFGEERERHQFALRFIPTNLSSLSLDVVPRLIGIFIRTEWDLLFYLSRMSDIPLFLYSLPNFFLSLTSFYPTRLSSLLLFLLEKIHSVIETDSKLTERLLSLCVTCTEKYSLEMERLVIDKWESMLSTWLNPHYDPCHRCLVINVLYNIFRRWVTKTNVSSTASLPPVTLNTSNIPFSALMDFDDEEDAFFLSAALEVENTYLQELSDGIKPILSTLERCISKLSFHLRPSDIQLSSFEWQESQTLVAFFTNTISVAAILLKVVEKVRIIYTEATVTRWTSFKLPSTNVPLQTRCFRCFLFAHHFLCYGSKISDIRVTELLTIASFDPNVTTIHTSMIYDFLIYMKNSTFLSLCDIPNIDSLPKPRNALVVAIFHAISVSIQRKNNDLLSFVHQFLPHLETLCSVIEFITDFKDPTVSPVHELFSLISLEAGILNIQLPQSFLELLRKLQSFRSPVASMLSYLNSCKDEDQQSLEYTLNQFDQFIQEEGTKQVVDLLLQTEKKLRAKLICRLLQTLEKNTTDCKLITHFFDIFTLNYSKLEKITLQEIEPLCMFIIRLTKFLSQNSYMCKYVSKSIWCLLSVLVLKLTYLTQPRIYFPNQNFHLLSSITRMLFQFSLLQLSDLGIKISSPEHIILSYQEDELPLFLLKHRIESIQPMNFDAASEISRKELDLQLLESILKFFVSCYLTDPLLRSYLSSVLKPLNAQFENASNQFLAYWSNLFLSAIGAFEPEPYLW